MPWACHMQLAIHTHTRLSSSYINTTTTMSLSLPTKLQSSLVCVCLNGKNWPQPLAATIIAKCVPFAFMFSHNNQSFARYKNCAVVAGGRYVRVRLLRGRLKELIKRTNERISERARIFELWTWFELASLELGAQRSQISRNNRMMIRSNAMQCNRQPIKSNETTTTTTTMHSANCLCSSRNNNTNTFNVFFSDGSAFDDDDDHSD